LCGEPGEEKHVPLPHLKAGLCHKPTVTIATTHSATQNPPTSDPFIDDVVVLLVLLKRGAKYWPNRPSSNSVARKHLPFNSGYLLDRLRLRMGPHCIKLAAKYSKIEIQVMFLALWW